MNFRLSFSHDLAVAGSNRKDHEKVVPHCVERNNNMMWSSSHALPKGQVSCLLMHWNRLSTPIYSEISFFIASLGIFIKTKEEKNEG